LPNPGKGHNEALEIVNPVEHTRAAKDVNSDHVPENRATCTRSCRHVLATQCHSDGTFELEMEKETETVVLQGKSVHEKASYYNELIRRFEEEIRVLDRKKQQLSKRKKGLVEKIKEIDNSIAKFITKLTPETQENKKKLRAAAAEKQNEIKALSVQIEAKENRLKELKRKLDELDSEKDDNTVLG
jgi:chromosome segregation ATPase